MHKNMIGDGPLADIASKPQRGQPKKKPEDKKVPLTFSVTARNREAIKARVKPIVKRLDLEFNTKEEDYV